MVSGVCAPCYQRLGGVVSSRKSRRDLSVVTKMGPPRFLAATGTGVASSDQIGRPTPDVHGSILRVGRVTWLFVPGFEPQTGARAWASNANLPWHMLVPGIVLLTTGVWSLLRTDSAIQWLFRWFYYRSVPAESVPRFRTLFRLGGVIFPFGGVSNILAFLWKLADSV